MGFDATVTIHTLQLTHLRGFLMYLVAVLQTIALNHEAPRMQIVTDGESWDEETTMLVACNAPREGGGFAVAPDAVVSDGYLNYASVCQVSRLMMLRLIPEVMRGTHGRFKQVRLGQFRQLKLQSEYPITIHADGEVICGFGTDVKDVKIEVVPEALEIII
jgi:diacylglycerol kinase family enzyme